ncbi:MAG TPA: hypothetical protein VFU90_05125 [Candidatus Tumulicola sp.]|nr:hypothetical protein [Candidatus Tumulicola sp.]
MTAAAVPIEQAKDAGLRYVSDRDPGIERLKARGGFRYVMPDGTPVRDRSTLDRIARLAIPPAYTGVWICRQADGHLQATGRDARGRKQYRYHERWRKIRDATKYDRMLAFSAALPKIRRAVDRDLAKPKMPREKVIAAVVALLETTLIRIGNEEYVRANGSFGLTTLRNRHARVRGAKLRFEFDGKSGIRHYVDLHDRRLARVVARCQELPGQHLFSYVDDEGNAVPIDSSDVNGYIREISGDDFSAKDFRTWLATVYCARWLLEHPEESAGGRQRAIVDATRAVAKALRNTPAVCRNCYIHPQLFESYRATGRLQHPTRARSGRGLSADERLTIGILRSRTA